MQSSSSEEKIRFACEMIIQLMKELKCIENSEEKPENQSESQEKLITNSLILLLCLFQEDKKSSEFKEFSELEKREKNTIKECQRALLQT